MLTKEKAVGFPVKMHRITDGQRRGLNRGALLLESFPIELRQGSHGNLLR